MITTFKELELPQLLAESLEAKGFVNPTPVQAQSIPHALLGQDVIASAQTGTGKTLGFVIPMITKLLQNTDDKGLILVPTRELAIQVNQVVKALLTKDMHMGSAVLIGGDSMSKQLRQLKSGPRIIVGTPGRINDHIMRKSLRLGQTTFLVLDETDRMLDMGFGIQIETIIELLDPERQTLMFSATMPKKIFKVADQYLTNPKKIEIAVDNSDALRIKQDFLHTKECDKFQVLVNELESRSGSVVLFVKTKRRAEKIAKELSRENHKTNYIHGDLKQRQREAVIKKFRNSDFRVMVATDVAARGLDIPHIEHVVNYDLPHDPEDYIHRIGRTGRNGATGAAISLISTDDRKQWADLQYFLDPETKGERPKGKGGNSKRRSGGRGRSSSSDSFDFRRGSSNRSDRSSRDDRPSRGSKPSRFSRDDRPSRDDNRSERSSRFSRDDNRSSRDDRYSRDERPSRQGERNDRPKGARFSKGGNNSGGNRSNAPRRSAPTSR